MNEFEVLVTPKVGSIETNFNDVKKALELEMSAYRDMEVTEENLPESKKDLAFLRKVKKSINDKKIEIKKAYMLPYEKFEGDCKDLMKVVDEPIEEISAQLETFEQKRIIEKKHHLTELYKDNIKELEEYISFDSTLESNWSNVGYKDKDYIFHLSEMTTKVSSEISAIKSLGSEIEEECLKIYKSNGNNLAMAIQRNTQYLNDKAKVVEEQKIAPTVTSEPKEVWVDQETGEIIPDFTFRVSGNENIQKVKDFLDFSEIPYVEV